MLALDAAVPHGLARALEQVAGGETALGADLVEELDDTPGADEVDGLLALAVRGCHEGEAAGFGAEIAATAAETVGCKVKRLGAPRIPVGYAPVLEAQSRVTVAGIVSAAKSLLT